MAADSPLSWEEERDDSAGATALPPSGLRLPGLLVKRTVFERSTEMVPLVQDMHIVGVHCSAPVELNVIAERQVERFLVAPGQLALGPAGYAQERAWDKCTEDVLIGIAPGAAYLGSSGAAVRPAVGVHDPLIAQLGIHLASTFEMGTTGDSLYADALAHALGAHLVEHYSDGPTVRQERPPDSLSSRQLKQVFDYIECNLQQRLTVTELAALAGVSPSHFTRLFRQQTGEPPHRYLRNRRLARAERLIVGTQLPLAEIAVAVGFSDQSHLNRVMRVERGVTPAVLRDSVT